MQAAEAELSKFVPLVSQLPGEQMTLIRIRPLMKLLGDPQDQLKVVHVAGTSGKTSTSYYISAMLTQAGRKTGLTVSPHIDTVRERVQINQEPISEQQFCKYLAEFLDTVQELDVKPTYFELLYAFAIWVFAQEKAEYAVVETGMGGLYDATNVVTNSSKVCVITDIGLDHMHILGNTVELIALQKAGIIHHGNQVFMLEQSSKLNKLIKDVCISKEAHYSQISEQDMPPGIAIHGYQKRNFLLAYNTYKYLINRDKLRNLTGKELTAVSNQKITGRMETYKLNNRQITFDGAHNLQKLEAFIDSYKSLYPKVKPIIVFALKEQKELDEFVNSLTKLSPKLIITTFKTTQDLPVKSLRPNASHINDLNANNINIQLMLDQQDVITYIANSNDEDFVITGSFYLISQLKPKILRRLT